MKKFRYERENKGMAVVRYFVKHLKINSSGHGVAGFTCENLWNMTDEEFDKLFG